MSPRGAISRHPKIQNISRITLKLYINLWSIRPIQLFPFGLRRLKGVLPLTIKSTINFRTIAKSTKSALNPPPTAIKMPEAENSSPPVFNFASHPSTSPFTASSQTYLSNHPGAKYKYIATSSLVFDSSNYMSPRILLIQRSENDSSPGRWEIPGGGCDDDDVSILHAVAREL